MNARENRNPARHRLSDRVLHWLLSDSGVYGRVCWNPKPRMSIGARLSPCAELTDVSAAELGLCPAPSAGARGHRSRKLNCKQAAFQVAS